MNTGSFNLDRSALAALVLLLAALFAHAASAQTNHGTVAPAVDIHDIRGPKPIPSPWLIPLIALTALAGVAGGYAAWVWNRRRFNEASKGPLDVALERLEEARQLMTPPQGREFSIEVSSAVRDYIESRFTLRAAHLTTDEFLHQLLVPGDSLLHEHRTLLDNFLQTCDLAKFGGWNLATADMDAMLQSARQFIVASADTTQSQRSAPAPQPSIDQPMVSTSRETYVSLPSA